MEMGINKLTSVIWRIGKFSLRWGIVAFYLFRTLSIFIATATQYLVCYFSCSLLNYLLCNSVYFFLPYLICLIFCYLADFLIGYLIYFFLSYALNLSFCYFFHCIFENTISD